MSDMSAILAGENDFACAEATEHGKRKARREQNPLESGEIKMATNWGGSRPGAGRPAKRAIERLPLGERWYVVQTQPHRERTVARELIEGESRPGFAHRMQFEIDLPMIAVRVQRQGRYVVERVVMFPGYVFVKFDAEHDPWQPIRQCAGVIQLFMTRSLRPIPLPPGFIEALADEAAQRLDLKAPKMSTYMPRDLLRVESGPFTSFAATCLECDGLTTRVLVDIFGRSTEVVMPRSWLGRA